MPLVAVLASKVLERLRGGRVCDARGRRAGQRAAAAVPRRHATKGSGEGSGVNGQNEAGHPHDARPLAGAAEATEAAALVSAVAVPSATGPVTAEVVRVGLQARVFYRAETIDVLVASMLGTALTPTGKEAARTGTAPVGAPVKPSAGGAAEVAVYEASDQPR